MLGLCEFLFKIALLLIVIHIVDLLTLNLWSITLSLMTAYKQSLSNTDIFSIRYITALLGILDYMSALTLGAILNSKIINRKAKHMAPHSPQNECLGI